MGLESEEQTHQLEMFESAAAPTDLKTSPTITPEVIAALAHLMAEAVHPETSEEASDEPEAHG